MRIAPGIVDMTAATGSKTRYSLKKHIWRHSYVALCAVLILAIVVLFGIARAYLTMRTIHHTQALIRELRIYSQLFIEAESGQRGYLLTHDDAYLKPYTVALAALDDQTEKLRFLDNDGLLKGRLSELDAIFRDKAAELATTIDLARKDQIGAALAVVKEGRGRRDTEEFWRTYNEVASKEEALLTARQSKSYRENLQAIVLLGAIIVMTAVYFPLAARRMTRDLVYPLQALVSGMGTLSGHAAAPRLDVAFAAEVDQVVCAFNKMADDLEQANADRDKAESMLQNHNRRLAQSLREAQLQKQDPDVSTSDASDGRKTRPNEEG
jgi:methyl-accepting chemotaxis protein